MEHELKSLSDYLSVDDFLTVEEIIQLSEVYEECCEDSLNLNKKKGNKKNA